MEKGRPGTFAQFHTPLLFFIMVNIFAKALNGQIRYVFLITYAGRRIPAASENDTGRDKGSKKHNLLICQELSRKSKGGI